MQIDWVQTLDNRRWLEIETYKIENTVVAKAFQNISDRLTPEQREEVILSSERSSNDPNLQGLLIAGGAMTAAKASDFGVYLMASTALGSLTNVLGITLQFAIYMGISQAIAIAIGPIGWLALLGGLAATLNQPNWQRLTLAVIYVAIIRHDLVEKRVT
ncbi:MAG: hypothetical protein AAFQ89_22175 [Cyanobacteria bacterium J06626_18]